MRSCEPVPHDTTFPRTICADGELRLSMPALILELTKKCIVVSKLIFCNGDGFDSIAFRLNGLYVPSKVM